MRCLKYLSLNLSRDIPLNPLIGELCVVVLGQERISYNRRRRASHLD